MFEAPGEQIYAIFPLLKPSDPGLDFGNLVLGQWQEMPGLNSVPVNLSVSGKQSMLNTLHMKCSS